MIPPITRIYDTPRQALDTHEALQREGYTDRLVCVLAPPADQPANARPTADSLVAQIIVGHVLKAEAKVYASEILQGKSLVSVYAAFGTGLVVTHLMDSFGPAESAVKPETYPLIPWDDAAPFSSALQMPVFLKEDWNFSSMFGMGMTSDNPAPLSSLFGLRLLARRAAPLSSMLGLPLLSDNPAPFSSLLRLPLFAKDR